MPVSIDAHDGTGSGLQDGAVVSANYTGLTPTGSSTAIGVTLLINTSSAPVGLTCKWDTGTSGRNQSMSIVAGPQAGPGNIRTWIFGISGQGSSLGTPANQITAAWSSPTSVDAYMGGVSFAGSDTSSAFSHGTTNSGTGGTVSVAVTSTSNSFVMGYVSNNGSGFSNPIGQTQNVFQESLTDNGAGNYTTGAASVTLTATLTSGTDAWGWVGVSVDPPSGDTLAASPGLRFMRRKSIGWTPLSDHRSRIFRPRPKFYLPRKTILKAA